jgi:hypothetical protein
MSVNGYIKYLFQVETVRNITGISDKAKPTKNKGYDVLASLAGLMSKSKGRPMGASDEDKAIYDIE